jgi:hypothetical protein
VSTEQQFWAEETQRRMAEAQAKGYAAAARQHAEASAAGPHWTELEDDRRHHVMHEAAARQQRQLDESTRAHAAAVQQKHQRLGFVPLGELDFDAPSPVELAYQQDVDRQARWQQFRATAQAAESGWVRHEQPPSWFK